MSSARAVAKVKHLLGAKKVGHAGTLDPFATGVLVCCINKATRLAQFFLNGRKRYQAIMRLGEETDTQDITGTVVASSEVPQLSEEVIATAVHAFQGELMQQPPIFSALKHKGEPLYKLARQGQPVQKPPRPVTVWAIEVTAVQLPNIHLDVTCSAGTYVRTLCADIGHHLNCGGHLVSLRRTASSQFTIGQALSLEMIEAMDKKRLVQRELIPMAATLPNMARFQADAAILKRVACGQPLTTDHLADNAIEQPEGKALQDHIKVVDDQENLKAVLKQVKGKATYDYCCVFH